MSVVNNRRDFLKISGLASAGLILGIPGLNAAQTIVKLDGVAAALELNPFVMISPSGQITLVNSRPDMGQGSYQAVPSIIAEELEVSLDKINIIPSDGNAQFGSQQSGGSSTVRGLWENLRKAGATAKEMLIQAAANKWKVSPADCYAEDGKVYNKNTRASFTYGELVTDASKLEVPTEPKLKEVSEFKILGKYAKRLDVPAKVTGEAVFGIDIVVPNMFYAVTVHAPSVQGKLVSFNDVKAKAVKGVKHVLTTDHSYPGGKTKAVAVVADNYWAALKASKLLEIVWDNSQISGSINSDQYFADMEAASKKPGVRAEETGDFDAMFAASENTLEGLYETPFLSHAAIEPVNATAHVKADGSVEVWAPIQGPDGALEETAAQLGIDKSKVKIHPTLLGGSFGRKAFMNFMAEAIDLSKQVQAPVKVIWPREEDMAQGPFRPAMMSKLRGIIGRGNSLAAFSHQAIGESIQGQHWNGIQAFRADDWIAGELSMENHKYGFGVHHLSYSRVKTAIPILWWRSVYASNFAWGQECFIDEMAHKAGKDPLKARKELLRNSPRDIKVLDKLESMLASYPPLPTGHARGIAMFRSFSSMSASAVEVAKVDGEIKIVKVTSIIDCGLFVNPDMVKAQTEGNIVMGLTAAIKGGITFNDGKCDQTNFNTYEVMRLQEMPIVDIHIMENQEKPGGVGEPGLPPIAPALGNAIFNLTGVRLRRLPIDLTDVG